ncbi:putative olfactory ionotropic receptor IR4-like 5, partial [Homarus americanus]
MYPGDKVTAVMTGLIFLVVTVFLTDSCLLPSVDKDDAISAATEGVDAVLAKVTKPHCSMFLLTDGRSSPSNIIRFMDVVRAPWGIGMFEVASDNQDVKDMEAEITRVLGLLRTLRQVSWCVTVVVVSDDPAFLAAFAEWSLKGRLLVWSTRLLAVTSLPLPKLHHLHKTFSTRNAMMLIVENVQEHIKCDVYIYLPYSHQGAPATRIASWTPQRGLALTTHLLLFPDKFTKLMNRPNLVVATEGNPFNKMIIEEDREAPEGHRVRFSGPVPELIDYLAT